MEDFQGPDKELQWSSQRSSCRHSADCECIVTMPSWLKRSPYLPCTRFCAPAIHPTWWILPWGQIAPPGNPWRQSTLFPEDISCSFGPVSPPVASPSSHIPPLREAGTLRYRCKFGGLVVVIGMGSRASLRGGCKTRWNRMSASKMCLWAISATY